VAYKQANAEAYKTVFFTTLAFSGTGMLISLLYPNVDHLMTNEVSVQLHESGKETTIGKRTQEKVPVEEV